MARSRSSSGKDSSKRGRRLRGEGSIFRRSSDGRWVGKLTHPRTGKRIVVYGRSAEEARAKLQRAHENVRANRPPVPVREKLGAFLEKWLEDAVRDNVRPATYQSYAELVRLHIAPELGGIALGDLQPMDVQEWITRKRDSGLSARRIQYAHAVLRAALGRAEEWGIVDQNVAKKARPPRVSPAKVQPYDADEARTLLSAVREHRLGALFTVAISTGLRQGEILGLRWGDIDLEAGQLHVRHTLHWINGKRDWTLAEPKTDRSARTLDLPTVTLVSLEAHRIRQAVEQRIAGPSWQDRNFVFTTPAGRPLEGANVTHTFHRILKAAGLRRQRFHDLRHAAASLWLSQGLQLREIMDALGHSQISLTANLYTHLQPAMRREAADRMDAVLSGG